MVDPDLIDIDRELCVRPGGLKQFIEMAWPQVEPARIFQSNWHIDAICDHLEAVFRGEINRLVINIPPGTSKSLCVAVFWPSWSWTTKPEMKWITSSYSDSNARRDSLRARQLMETQWYQERWGDKWRRNPHIWTATRYNNDKAGFRMAVTVGGSITGEHADIQIVDDPVKPLDASQSKIDTTALKECIEWWDNTMSTRLVDTLRSARVIVMQRLHERDLSGHVLRRGGYEHLMLPMRFESIRKCRVEVTGFEDPRQKDGELLWPERFSESALKVRAFELGPMSVAGQEQQRPAPAEGGIVKKEWIKFFSKWPTEVDNVTASWDMTFKKEGSSWCVGQLWWRSGSDCYILHQERGRWDFTVALKKVIALRELAIDRWGSLKETLIEDAANGPAIISTLRSSIPSIIPIRAKESKVERLSNVSPMFEAGNVWLPDRILAPWVDALIDELISFPNAADDDQVDALSMALNRYKTFKAPVIQMNLDIGAQTSPWRFA